jgi:hypothetical protein
VCPMAAAAFCSASAAMNVCAIPVGHAVMPTSRFPATACSTGSEAEEGGTTAMSANAMAGGGAADGTCATAASMTCRVWRMASLVRTAWMGLPANRTTSTWMSDARMTTSAAAISASESASRAPAEPCVSTRRSCPMTAAVFRRASAAIIVCATPVGHAVTAAIFIWRPAKGARIQPRHTTGRNGPAARVRSIRGRSGAARTRRR